MEVSAAWAVVNGQTPGPGRLRRELEECVFEPFARLLFFQTAHAPGFVDDALNDYRRMIPIAFDLAEENLFAAFRRGWSPGVVVPTRNLVPDQDAGLIRRAQVIRRGYFDVR